MAPVHPVPAWSQDKGEASTSGMETEYEGIEVMDEGPASPFIVPASGAPGAGSKYRVASSPEAVGEDIADAGGGGSAERVKKLVDDANSTENKGLRRPPALESVDISPGDDSVAVTGWVDGDDDQGPLSPSGWVSKGRSSFNSKLQPLRRMSTTGLVPSGGYSRDAERRKVLNPRSKSVMRWDLLVSLLLLYTAVVTPFEVSFLTTKYNWLFFWNRIVDVCFLCDMAIQFFMPFQSPEGDWIVHRPAIWGRYLKGWFLVDFVSVVPYDLIGMLLGSDATARMKLLRFIRLLRLVKLLRVLRARRMFRRWESSMSVNYSVLELVKFIMMILSMSHWLACGWYMCAVLSECDEGDEECIARGELTWVNNYSFTDRDKGLFPSYITAYYWAAATVSTLGYGDVVPTTDGERMYATVCALVGATVYAYIIGAVCSIVSGMSERDTMFYNQMDSLNTFMKEKNLSPELRVKLRDFFRFLRYNAPLMDRNDLLYRMSPRLRGEVSLQMNAKWIQQVPVFRECSEDFIVALSMSLIAETYAHSEDVVKPGWAADKMFIVEKGIVGVAGKVVAAGGSFGEDMIYSRTTLSTSVVPRDWAARTLTNTALQVLVQATLAQILLEFPEERARVRRAVIRRTFRRAFMKYSEAVKKIWESYPDARLLDWRDEIEKCKGDTTKLPVYFHGKMQIVAIQNEGGASKRALDAAATTIATRYRERITQRGEQERSEKARTRARGLRRLQAFLSMMDFGQHEDKVAKHNISYPMLEHLMPCDLAAIGIPLGDAVDILQEFKKEKRREQKAEEEEERVAGGLLGRGGGSVEHLGPPGGKNPHAPRKMKQFGKLGRGGVRPAV